MKLQSECNGNEYLSSLCVTLSMYTLLTQSGRKRVIIIESPLAMKLPKKERPMYGLRRARTKPSHTSQKPQSRVGGVMRLSAMVHLQVGDVT